MPFISKESIERVKEAADMVDVVSAYCDLRQQGQRYVGLCPFHEERTPSFSVDPVGKVYYCFGCEAGGDIFRFVEQTEALSFAQSVEQLADRFGVELAYEQGDPEREELARQRERLLELLNKTADFYARFLWESEEAAPARRHLSDRGLEEEVLKLFRVGYAPSKWDRVLKLASAEGYKQDEIYAAGLLARGKQDGFYDRFRARIMFPLADARGRILGFGARALRDSQQPKYVNSPEGPLYHKGSTLFGIDQARAAAARSGEILVVEGYTDVLALYQADFKNAVAIMGTALTTRQISELARLAGSIVFALDADSAGQEAMLRALQVARARQLDLKVVRLPDDKDPCDLLQAGGREDFEGRLEGAKSLLEFQVERVLEKADLSSARGRDEAVNALVPVFEAAPPSVERDEQLRAVAGRLDLPDHLLTIFSEKPASRGARDEIPAGPATRGETMERTYLAMCLAVGDQGQDYLRKVDRNHFTSELLIKARDLLLERFDDAAKAVDTEDRELVELISELVVRSGEEPASTGALEASFLSLELRRLEREIATARASADFERVRKLARERQDVIEAIDTATGAAL